MFNSKLPKSLKGTRSLHQADLNKYHPTPRISTKTSINFEHEIVDLVTAEKQEHVLFIKMTKKQDKIYQKFLNSEAVKRVITGDAVCFTVLQVMVYSGVDANFDDVIFVTN